MAGGLGVELTANRNQALDSDEHQTGGTNHCAGQALQRKAPGGAGSAGWPLQAVAAGRLSILWNLSGAASSFGRRGCEAGSLVEEAGGRRAGNEAHGARLERTAHPASWRCGASARKKAQLGGRAALLKISCAGAISRRGVGELQHRRSARLIGEPLQPNL